MLKGTVKIVPLSKGGNRMFQSYVNEFCGMVSAGTTSSMSNRPMGGGVLASNTLRFSLNAVVATGVDRGRSGDINSVNPCKIINFPCHVKVSHT